MAIGKQAKVLTDKQQSMILSYLDKTRYSNRNKTMFLLSYKAGLRAKEIASLKWSMVCDSQGVVSNTINLPNNASKGAYSGRIIPIHKDLSIALNTLQSEQLSYTGANYVITSERGYKLSAQAVVNFFWTLYKNLGVEGCSSHSGRRTFITKAAMLIGSVGGSLNDVRLLAGHSSLATTQRYIEYNTEAHKNVVNMI